MAPIWLARQFALPAGILGRLVGWMMNRGNVRMNADALFRLDVQSSDRVLELGFGGGINLPTLLRSAGHVTGVEPSTEMLARARRVHREAIEAGKLLLFDGRADAIPVPDASIDKAVAVNSVYFWPDRPVALRELRRTLAAGGLVVLTFLRGERMQELGSFPASVFRFVRPDDLCRELDAAGFSDATVHRPDGVQWVTVTARAA